MIFDHQISCDWDLWFERYALRIKILPQESIIKKKFKKPMESCGKCWKYWIFRTFNHKLWFLTGVNVIEITEYSYDIYYAFLKYLYNDCIDIKPKKAVNLLVLADNYKEEELKLKCVDIIKADIILENMCPLYCALIEYNLLEIEDFYFNFAITKMN